jgi:hypothetical protein
MALAWSNQLLVNYGVYVQEAAIGQFLGRHADCGQLIAKIVFILGN